MRFSQVDVFAAESFRGNPVAVIHDADEVTEQQMLDIARWTNLSETTFLLTPSSPDADYRVRIFTPGGELPFAGHPTLGTARAWLAAGGVPAASGVIVQECPIGLVTVRQDGDRLAFAAPDLLRSGPVDDADLDRATRALGLPRDAVVRSAWIDNGPGWMGLVLDSAEAVLAVRPDFAVFDDLKLGVLGAHPGGRPADVEVRAFCPGYGPPEDPVTGSLNAGFATWLIGEGVLPASYVARQGTAIERAGRVYLDAADGRTWVGGEAVVRVAGDIEV